MTIAAAAAAAAAGRAVASIYRAAAVSRRVRAERPALRLGCAGPAGGPAVRGALKC
jgi:hypothetical protein